jgi:hypothetical protein
MVDVSFDLEKYNGFWNQAGKYVRDPAGSNLRVPAEPGYAQRLASRWQASIAVPYLE